MTLLVPGLVPGPGTRLVLDVLHVLSTTSSKFLESFLGWSGILERHNSSTRTRHNTSSTRTTTSTHAYFQLALHQLGVNSVGEPLVGAAAWHHHTTLLRFLVDCWAVVTQRWLVEG
jgi:hypothetical protein